MGKFLDALKNLGNKLNGTTPSSTTTVAVINEIADDFANGTTATKAYVNSLMSGALKRAIVEELPTTDIDPNTIYMVLDTEAASGNVYNEYLYIEEAWELIGTTEVQTNHLYQHNFYLNETGSISAKVYFSIYTANATQMTYDDIYDYLNTRGFTSVYENGLSATGYIKSDGLTEYNTIIKISADTDSGNLACIFAPTSGNWYDIVKANTTVTDTVVQLF